MYYEPDKEHKVNRIEVKGETVFDFDLSQGWKVASVTWRDHDRLMICVERMDEPQTEEWHYDEKDFAWYPYKHEDKHRKGEDDEQGEDNTDS